MFRFSAKKPTLLGAMILFAPMALGQNSPADAVGGLSYFPVLYRIQAQPGKPGTIELNISSPRSAPVEARLSIHSFLLEEWSYRSQYDVPHALDASSWFKERNVSHTVKTATAYKQVFNFNVPQGAHGSYWAMLLFEPKPVGSTQAAKFVYEIPIMIAVGTPLSPHVRVGAPEITQANKSTSLSLSFINDGTGFGLISASAKVTDLGTNQVVTTTMVRDRNLFPSSKRRVNLGIPNLKPGRYRASVNAEFGAIRLPAVTADIDVGPGGKVSTLKSGEFFESAPLSVAPYGLTMPVAAGGSRIQAVRVANNGKEPLTVKMELTGVEQTSDGAVGPSTGAPSKLVKVSCVPDTLTIAPKSTATIRVTVSTDKSATGDLWFGLLFKPVDKPGLIPQQILGVASIGKTLFPDLQLVSKGFQKNRQGVPLLLNYQLKNVGNSGIKPVSNAGVLDLKGKLIAELQVPTATNNGIIPGAVLNAEVMLPPNLADGKYLVKVQTRYGPKSIAVLTVPFTVVNSGPVPILPKRTGK